MDHDLTNLVLTMALFTAVYNLQSADRIAAAARTTRRGTRAGNKRRFAVSTEQTFSGDGCNMRAGTEGRGSYWLVEQVPIAHVGATMHRNLDARQPILELVPRDLSYYDKFAPRSVGTYDWQPA